MDLEFFSSIFSSISSEGIFQAEISTFIPLFYVIIMIAIYSVCVWHFYRYIARRDCFKIPKTRHPKLISFTKYFFIYPFVAFLFFLGFSLTMLLITQQYSIATLLTSSFTVVVAIRITAYYNEDLSKDVAKMLPFALLALYLVDPSYFSFEEMIVKINALPDFLNLCIQFIILIVFTEWLLRCILISKKTIELHHYTSHNRKNIATNISN
jgi:hypothetical protein